MLSVGLPLASPSSEILAGQHHGHPLNLAAQIRSEVSYISGEKMGSAGSERGEEDRYILFWQKNSLRQPVCLRFKQVQIF